MGRLILPDTSQENTSIYPKETGVLGQLGQGVLDTGAFIAGIPGSVASGIGNLVFTPEQQEINRKAFGAHGSPIGSIPQALSKARQSTGYTEPQTTAQKFAYNVGSVVPQAVAGLFTGGVVPAVAAGLGSATAKTAAQELGLGTVGEIAASLIGGGLGSNLARGGTKAIAHKIIPIRKESYATAERLGKEMPLRDIRDIEKGLKGIEVSAKNWLSGPLYKKYYNQIRHDIHGINNSIKNNTATIWDLVRSKQKLNDIIYDNATPQRVKTFFQEARNNLNGLIGLSEKTNPAFAEAYRKGENLTTFIKGSERFKDFFKKHTELNGLLSELPQEVTHIIKQLGSVNSFPKSLIKAATIPVGVPLKYAASEYKNARELLSNPATSQLLEGLYQGIAEDNVGTVARSLLSLIGDNDQQITQTKPLSPATTSKRGRLLLPS
ncbi:MAG TPA: hypothetical protein VHA52_02285 [Candidatus Babeliaceae bacterium]|nr:hypothetical protein [Candidatus Babeliaceae bacterium]